MDPVYPRFAEARLLEALSDTPVMLVHGPRQCGKTTLAQRVGKARGHGYFSFDDVVTLAAATVTAADFRGLRKLRDAAGTGFAAGIVLYDGETSAGFGDGLYAVPLRMLWEPV